MTESLISNINSEVLGFNLINGSKEKKEGESIKELEEKEKLKVH